MLFYLFVEHFERVSRFLHGCYRAVSPLVYGVAIAFVINLIVVKLEQVMTGKPFENQAVKRTTSMILSVLILAGLITVICFGVVPGVADGIRQIRAQAPQAANTAVDFLQNKLGISEELIDSVQNFRVDEDMLDHIVGLMENRSVIQAIKASGNVVGSILSVIAKFFIGLFFAFYILAKKERIGDYIHRMLFAYLPERVARNLEYVGHIIYDTYANFISGQCVDSAIFGMLVGIAMGIFRMPYPVLVGVIVGVTALVPVVGSFVGGGVGVILAFMDSPIKALTFLILFLVLQQIDNRLIYPHVVGGVIGIPSILIFAAIIIGGEFGGVIGMFLGIPFTAVLFTLLDRDLELRRGKRIERLDTKPE